MLTDGPNLTSLIQSVHIVNSLDEFESFTNSNYSTIVPGGLFLGEQRLGPNVKLSLGYWHSWGIFGGLYPERHECNALEPIDCYSVL